MKNLTKSFILLALLLTLGVGQLWADSFTSDGNTYFYLNKTQYIKNSSDKIDYTKDGDVIWVYMWNATREAWYRASNISGDVYGCQVTDADTFTKFIITRKQSSKDYSGWDGVDNQTNDYDFKDNKNYKTADGWDSYGSPSLAGSMNDWNAAANEFRDGELEISLSANTAYMFKILDGSTWYGCGNPDHDYTFVGQTDSVVFSDSPGKNIMIMTSVAGIYRFGWCSSTKKLKITYPDAPIKHPNMNFVYMEKYSDWNGGSFCHIDYWDGTPTHLTTGDKNPKMTASTYYINARTGRGDKNFYIFPILSDYPNFKAAQGLNGDGGGGGHATSDMVSTGKGGHYVYHNGSAWVWEKIKVYIRLEDEGADEGHKGTRGRDVAFNDTSMNTAIVCPEKTHYTFGGYYTGVGGTGTQIIRANGKWIPSVADFTTADTAWIHAGDTTTLYAKWTEIKHDVTVAVSPAGAGSVQISGASISKVENIGYETHSSVMTAVPSHPAWKFKEWQETSDVHLDLKNYSRYGNTMEITATGDDQTLTAVFEPRFTLVGSKTNDEPGGMPGWDYYDASREFTINSTDPLDVTKECTLEASTQYKFEIHDRIDGNFGDGKDGQYKLIEGNTAHCTNSSMDMWFTTTGAGKYIFKITAIDGSNRASVQLLWPHQVNFGRRTVDIDGGTHDDDTGGTLSVKAADTTITSGTWHTYNTNVAYDAKNKTGYNQKWYGSSDYTGEFDAGGKWNHALISNDNCYAQFNELSTPVELNNDGHGKIQISSTDKTSTTCGIDTHRELTAVPNTGYLFSSWSHSGADIELTDTETNPTTLSSLGGGIKVGQSVTANFSAKTYSVKLNNDHGGEPSTDGSATATYDATSLSSRTDATFDGWTLLGYWNSSAVQVVNANGSLRANVGGYTNSDSKWINDADGTVDLWAHWSRSITLDKNGDYDRNGAVTVTFNSTAGTPVITTTPTRSDYAVEGYYTNAACTTKVMEPSGKLLKNVSGYTDSDGKWIKKDAATLYTKWVYVIYRTGDSGGDVHKTVYHETYAGGTISEKIEYRMKVSSVGKWYSLSIPFSVDSVCVWDEEDGMYYKMQPYYYSGEQFKSGHYVIRTPNFLNNEVDSIAISRFGDWVDPESKAFTPAANKPYIIQWPHSYFQDRYVSFFGHDVTIPLSMTVKDAPTADNVVNVYANDAMVSGSVEGAYVLDSDYGVGAWLRGADPKDDTTVPPFECYIRANSEVTGRFLVIRNGMNTDDNPTGLFPVINNPTPVTAKVLINGQLYIIREGKMYTVQGTLVK